MFKKIHRYLIALEAISLMFYIFTIYIILYSNPFTMSPLNNANFNLLILFIASYGLFGIFFLIQAIVVNNTGFFPLFFQKIFFDLIIKIFYLTITIFMTQPASLLQIKAFIIFIILSFLDSAKLVLLSSLIKGNIQ